MIRVNNKLRKKIFIISLWTILFLFLFLSGVIYYIKYRDTNIVRVTMPFSLSEINIKEETGTKIKAIKDTEYLIDVIQTSAASLKLKTTGSNESGTCDIKTISIANIETYKKSNGDKLILQYVLDEKVQNIEDVNYVNVYNSDGTSKFDLSKAIDFRIIDNNLKKDALISKNQEGQTKSILEQVGLTKEDIETTVKFDLVVTNTSGEEYVCKIGLELGKEQLLKADYTAQMQNVENISWGRKK